MFNFFYFEIDIQLNKWSLKKCHYGNTTLGRETASPLLLSTRKYHPEILYCIIHAFKLSFKLLLESDLSLHYLFIFFFFIFIVSSVIIVEIIFKHTTPLLAAYQWFLFISLRNLNEKKVEAGCGRCLRFSLGSCQPLNTVVVWSMLY